MGSMIVACVGFCGCHDHIGSLCVCVTIATHFGLRVCDVEATFGRCYSGCIILFLEHRVAMPSQLSRADQTTIDASLRARMSPVDVITKLNKKRVDKGVEPAARCTIYRFIAGSTHRRNTPESRGRHATVSRKDISNLDQVRKRLLKRAGGERTVTYDEIQREAGMQDCCCSRTMQDALRSRGVRFRAPRQKVYLTKEDAKQRLIVAKRWVKRPAAFWTDSVHAYVDNKAFPLPLTPKQKAMLRRTSVTGHLRKANEGLSEYCTMPGQKHSFLGVPSVTISAAVAKDRIIMWHVVEKTWNGASAAAMYSGPLSAALKRTWGLKRQDTTVEDGDRKGNQSGKGLKAKEESKHRAMTLPPRTPSWMPLDFAIWRAVEEKMTTTAPGVTETKAEYLVRLQKAARSLPRPFVRKVLARMKNNIQAVIDAGGFHAKND